MTHVDADVLALLAIGEAATTDARLAHLDTCGICRVEVQGLRRAWEVTRQTVEEDRDPSAPPERIWAGIQQELEHAPQAAETMPDEGDGSEPASPGPRRRLAVAFAAAAAVAAVVVVGGLTWWSDASEEVLASITLEPLAEVEPVAARLVRDGDRMALEVESEGLDAPDGYHELWLLDRDAAGMISLGSLEAGQRVALPEGLDPRDFPVVDCPWSLSTATPSTPATASCAAPSFWTGEPRRRRFVGRGRRCVVGGHACRRFGRRHGRGPDRHWVAQSHHPLLVTTAAGGRMSIAPADVHATLGRHILADGFDMVLDTVESRGSWLVDARDGTRYLDLFTFFASSPLGMNHPGLVEDAEFMAELARVAVNKPSNSDVYTTHMAEFVRTFARVLGDPALPHLFFVEGGGLAVENALKVAFDWKSRRNEAAGRDPGLGTKVLHLERAFHGRTGYTMSLTNTEPGKVARFPKLDWPRIASPAITFPLSAHLAEVEAAEEAALAQARQAFADHPDDIACFIAEPIQGEGGDNHLRAEFLQAVQELCRANDALFVLDEVQTGGGLTGTAWAYQQLGVAPDVVAFGKKLQVCGVMAGGRVDEVADNVFTVSSRINSTWGGNLTDMVRARRILEVVEADDLIAGAAKLGAHLLGRLQGIADDHPHVTNPRGRGLMCALDLPDGAARDLALARLRDDERVLMLGCGRRTIRFRPTLAVTTDEFDAACDALDRVLSPGR